MKHLGSHLAELFTPLAEFYTLNSAELPSVTIVECDEIPAPYRDLLVHQRDMTSTLERFWGSRVHLKILEKHDDDVVLTRQVVLVTDGDERPVEFGAIRIHLNRFEPEPRRDIRSGGLPLGSILEHYRVEYRCQPQIYFSMTDDPIARRVLALDESATLYGRQNRIMNARGEVLADVVEILSPADSPDPSAT